MKLSKSVKIILVFAVIFISAYGTSYSQKPSSEIWIKVRDYFPAGGKDEITNWLGNHIDARFYPLDTLELSLFNPPDSCSRVREVSGPPAPPAWGTWWGNIKNRPINPYGFGLVIYDFRGLPTNATKKDTFHLYFQNEYSKDSADFLIRWPNAVYLAERCDSMKLNYLDPNADPISQWVDMFSVDSLVIPLATLNGIKDLLIYKYGCKFVDGCGQVGVKEESRTIPTGFSLYPNYPNPFNPSTTLRFDIEKSAMTEISIYNVLGQKVITLVSEELSPGTYSRSWNGLNAQGNSVASGVYYVRMAAHQTASQGTTKEFTALQKLLLLK